MSHTVWYRSHSDRKASIFNTGTGQLSISVHPLAIELHLNSLGISYKYKYTRTSAVQWSVSPNQSGIKGGVWGIRFTTFIKPSISGPIHRVEVCFVWQTSDQWFRGPPAPPAPKRRFRGVPPPAVLVDFEIYCLNCPKSAKTGLGGGPPPLAEPYQC